jgi:hypothetical protein
MSRKSFFEARFEGTQLTTNIPKTTDTQTACKSIRTNGTEKITKRDIILSKLAELPRRVNLLTDNRFEPSNSRLGIHNRGEPTIVSCQVNFGRQRTAERIARRIRSPPKKRQCSRMFLFSTCRLGVHQSMGLLSKTVRCSLEERALTLGSKILPEI